MDASTSSTTSTILSTPSAPPTSLREEAPKELAAPRVEAPKEPTRSVLAITREKNKTSTPKVPLATHQQLLL
jgi:hypothetical protein